MKKKVLIIILLVILIGAGILYYNKKENERIDREAVTFKENLTIEFGEKAKVSDFIQNLNGTLLDDHEIDTEHLGEIEVSFEFINIKNKHRERKFTIKTLDVTNPQIFSGDSYTVTVGNEKKLEDVLLSGDDLDDNPKREIIGEYDFNEIGDYDLTYVVTDASGNSTSKDFVLHVIEKSDKKKDDEEEEKHTYFADVIENYKTDNVKIGIDVSKWQEEIDWETVKNSGVEFAIIRVGSQSGYDGEFILDPFFETNIEGALSNDIPVGIYFYSYAKNVDQAKEQAEWVKEQISKYEISLPVTFDWESWTSFNTTGMSFRTINKVAETFMDTLSENGYKGMLYGSKNYLTKIWYPTEHETWLAHYTEKTDYTGDYSIWQMCEDGKIDGIEKNVDIDIMYVNENKGGI